MSELASDWHALERGEAQERLQTGPHGLTRAEARARLSRHGPNELEEAPPPSRLATFLHQFRSPLIYILLVAAVVTAALGEYVDAAVIAVILALNAIIGFAQEHRAERSVRALMRLASPRARVVREGKRVGDREPRAGPADLVLIESGVRVPADLRLISTTSLAVDESLLTGESVPSEKRERAVAKEAPLADRSDMVYTGTVVSRGRGRGVAVATGAATSSGRSRAASVKRRRRPRLCSSAWGVLRGS